MPGDLRLTQLARLFDRALTTTEDARNTIAREPDVLAAALLDEAAQNDDVISVEAARDYLEMRLADFGDLVGPGTADTVRAEFNDRLRSWE